MKENVTVFTGQRGGGKTAAVKDEIAAKQKADQIQRSTLEAATFTQSIMVEGMRVCLMNNHPGPLSPFEQDYAYQVAKLNWMVESHKKVVAGGPTSRIIIPGR